MDQGIELRGGFVRSESRLFRSGEHRQTRRRGRLQCRRLDFRRAGAVARKYAHKIPFIVKINHNELLSYPNSYDQVMFGTVRDAWNMGAAAVGPRFISARRRAAAGSRSPRRSIMPTNWAWRRSCGVTCATRSTQEGRRRLPRFGRLTGRPNHLGVTIKADIVKQKLPENNGGFRAIGFGKTRDEVYTA